MADLRVGNRRRQHHEEYTRKEAAPPRFPGVWSLGAEEMGGPPPEMPIIRLLLSL